MGQPSKEVKDKWLEENRHKRPEINRNWRLRNVYGITPEFYNQTINEQGDKCAICDIEFNYDTKLTMPHPDHDHSSGFFRGVLCNNCNSGLGMFHDNPDLLQKAIDYLISNSTPTEFVFTKISNPKRRHTDEWKESASKRMIGNKHREGITPWNKGKPWSEETKDKMSISAKNRCRKEG